MRGKRRRRTAETSTIESNRLDQLLVKIKERSVKQKNAVSIISDNIHPVSIISEKLLMERQE